MRGDLTTQKGVAMHPLAKVAVAASVAAMTVSATTGTAGADPVKKSFIIHVWCPQGQSTVLADTPYLTSQVGAAPVWLQQPDGSTVKTAIVYAEEWQVSHDPGTPSFTDLQASDAVFLFSKKVGNKTGFATVYHCMHFANWGTAEDPFYLEGPLDLGVVPSS